MDAYQIMSITSLGISLIALISTIIQWIFGGFELQTRIDEKYKEDLDKLFKQRQNNVIDEFGQFINKFSEVSANEETTNPEVLFDKIDDELDEVFDAVVGVQEIPESLLNFKKAKFKQLRRTLFFTFVLIISGILLILRYVFEFWVWNVENDQAFWFAIGFILIITAFRAINSWNSATNLQKKLDRMVHEFRFGKEIIDKVEDQQKE